MGISGSACANSFDLPAYTGPISNHFPSLHGSDFSWVLGIIVGSLVYWLLARRNVAREAAKVVVT